MKSKHYIILPVLMLALCSYINNSYERKKISNKLYSVSVPSNWVPFVTDKTDGFVPGERDATYPAGIKYHLYYLAWSSPARSEDDISNRMSLFIESYKRLDNQPVSIKEIEEEEMSMMRQSKDAVRKEISANANQKRFIITKTGTDISVRNGNRKVKRSTIYLLHAHDSIVHRVLVSMPDSLYLLPEYKKIAEDILDSFVPHKKKDGV